MAHKDQSIDIQDKREVKHAKWVPLTKLQHANDLEDTNIEYHLYPAAFEYLAVLTEQLKGYDQSDKSLSLTDFLIKHNLAPGKQLDQQAIQDGTVKPRGFNFYQ